MKRPNEAMGKYLFKTLRSIVLLNAKEKVCQEKASNILALVLFHTQLTLRGFSF